MGNWLFFKGYLGFNKEVTPEFRKRINDYVNNESFYDPEKPYCTVCPWIIDENDKLVIDTVRNSEHEEWLQYLVKKFFEPEGYTVRGILLYSSDEREGQYELLEVDHGDFYYSNVIFKKDINYLYIRKIYDRFAKYGMTIDEIMKKMVAWIIENPEKAGRMFLSVKDAA